MENKRERAHNVAEEGLDKLIEGDTETGEKLIDKAKKIDPKAVEELAEVFLHFSGLQTRPHEWP